LNIEIYAQVDNITSPSFYENQSNGSQNIGQQMGIESTEEAHRHIVKEAFKLLKLSYPNQLTEMEAHLGTNQTESTSHSRSFGQGYIVQGTYLEDHYDIVYHYGIFRRPEFNQSLPEPLIILIAKLLGYYDDINEGFQTITHFWDADNGDDYQSFLWGYISDAIYWSFSCENALQKIKLYENGGYNCLYLYDEPVFWYIDPEKLVLAFYFRYNSLIDFYNTGRYYVTQYLDFSENWFNWDSNIEYTMTETYRKNYSYEILGRMAHLLADMGVPAHAHSDAHDDGDSYEQNQNSFHFWTAQEIYNQGGRYIDPYVSSDPIRFLMYIVNQVADHYASNDYNGDNNYNSSNEYSILNSIIPYLGAPQYTYQINYINLKSMHDHLFPFVIRATAGLFYWFAVETGQITRTIPLTVRISGENHLNSGETGTFTANPSGGSGTYTNYKWWYRSDAGKVNPYSRSRRSGGGSIEPNFLPPGYWFYMSQWEGKQTVNVSGSYTYGDFSLKCELTDSEGNTATDIHSVTVGGVFPILSVSTPNQTVTLEEVPEELTLSNNYPNPFNPITTIRFGLPKDSKVTLTIYSLTGERVVTLVDERLSAGYHQVQWDGTNASGTPVASGVYVYELKTGQQRLVKKMLLVR